VRAGGVEVTIHWQQYPISTTISIMSDSQIAVLSQLSEVFSPSPSPMPTISSAESIHQSPGPTPATASQRRPVSPSESSEGSHLDGSGVARKRARLTEELEDEEDEDRDYSPPQARAESESESETEPEELETELEELEAELLEEPVSVPLQTTTTTKDTRKKRPLTSWIWKHGRWLVNHEDGCAYWICNMCKIITMTPGLRNVAGVKLRLFNSINSSSRDVSESVNYFHSV
jgi:hypothetical protein